MFFGTTKTLDIILAGFNKTVVDLEKFSSDSINLATTKRNDADILVIEANSLEADASKADRVRMNILSMLEG